jgi:hypothetical protein
MSTFPCDLFKLGEPVEGFLRRFADLANLPLVILLLCSMATRGKVMGVALMQIILRLPMAPLNILVAVEQSDGQGE